MVIVHVCILHKTQFEFVNTTLSISDQLCGIYVILLRQVVVELGVCLKCSMVFLLFTDPVSSLTYLDHHECTAY